MPRRALDWNLDEVGAAVLLGRFEDLLKKGQYLSGSGETLVIKETPPARLQSDADWYRSRRSRYFSLSPKLGDLTEDIRMALLAELKRRKASK